MRAERTAKSAKSREEGEDALATADDLVDCTGKEQSAGGETTSKDVSIHTDPVLLSVDEGYISKNKECSGVFLLPVFNKQTAEQLCGCMPVLSQLHMYKLHEQFHHVS